jgi:hypothetical protein
MPIHKIDRSVVIAERYHQRRPRISDYQELPAIWGPILDFGQVNHLMLR